MYAGGAKGVHKVHKVTYMKKYLLWGIAGIIGIVVVGSILVSQRETSKEAVLPIDEKKLQVSASFYPLYFFASRIGGDRADARVIVPAGIDPHGYEPTPKEMASIENDDLVIINGAGFEPWGENVTKNIDATKTILVVVGEPLATLEGHAHDHEHGHEDEHKEGHEDEHGHTEGHEDEHGNENEHEEMVLDPHVWLSPVLAKKIVDNITTGFVSADPKNASYYQVNAEALKQELSELDLAYQSGLAECGSKEMITSHSAFGYLAREYGLTQTSISGLSPEEESSTGELAEIADFAKEHEVKYIFFESLASPKLSETLASEIGAQTLVLNPLEGLTQEEVAQGKNYFSVMRDNLANLQTALSCKR